jgi:hypothetical protein
VLPDGGAATLAGMESLGDKNQPEEPRKAGNKRKAAAAVVPLLGLAVAAAGVVTAVLGWSQAVDFGFVAPAPDLFNPGGVAFLGPLTQAGYVIAVVGLLLLAFWAGHRRSGKSKATLVVSLLGLAVVIAGVGTTIVGSSQPVSFGWFAYAPLSNESFSASGVAFLGPMTQTGYLIAVVGLLVLAFWAGNRVGRRR